MISPALDTSFLSSDFIKKAKTHYDLALSALSQIKAGTCQGGEMTGWFDWPQKEGFDLLEKIFSFKSELAVYYDCVVVCGIGGSFIGAKAIARALSPHFSSLQSKGSYKDIFFAGHHLSESYLIDLMELLSERKPLLIVVSKTGTTTETSVTFRVLRGFFEKTFGKKETSERIIAVTDAASGNLRELAHNNQYKAFPVPGNVGGRFSVLTAVGLVPLVLAEYDCQELLMGADKVFSSLKPCENWEELPAVQLACLRRAAWDLGFSIDAFAYSDPRLSSFVEWWKQLFGESEGKKSVGMLPIGLAYSTDLHSLGQYLQEGPLSIMETFLFVAHPLEKNPITQIETRLRIPSLFPLQNDGVGYLEERFIEEVNVAAMKSAMIAHSSRGVPCLGLKISRMDTYHLGQLIAFYETACSISALLLDVNPFDQPGVEAYKKNLFAMMGKK